MVDHLAGHRVHMRAVLGGPDPVDKGHGELLVGRAVSHNNGPAVVRRLGHHRCTVGEERLGILQQTATLDQLVVVRYLHILAQRHGQIPHTTLNQPTHAVGDLRHAEPRKVRLPPDGHTQHIGLLLWRRNLGLANLGHVVSERLLIQ